MKWAAGIFAAMLYLVWPYYTLVELAGAIRAGDAPTINRLVDWDRVRASVKAQLQARLDNIRKTAEERETPAVAVFGSTLALTFANPLIDKMLTPEGIASLIQGTRDAPPTVKESHGIRPGTKPSVDANRQTSLWQRIKFAFLVSPIHFQLDLRAPDDGAVPAAASGDRPTVMAMLMFKGTAGQVSDVRLSGLDLSRKVALAPK
jgi:hypothetical protein